MDTENNKTATRDAINNEISSTNVTTHQLHDSSANVTLHSLHDSAVINNVTTHPFHNTTKTNNMQPKNTLQNSVRNKHDPTDISDTYSTNSSDTGSLVTRRPGTVMNESIVQSLADLDVQEPLHIPIVGYEVMEERARFTIYKLKVRDVKSKQSWLVFRRYTDFVRLYSRVKMDRPGISLPLPGKRWFRDNFQSGFLEERVRGLQVFINSITKRLPNHPRVREFFCLDEPPHAAGCQPELQAVCGALEDSVSSLRTQLRHRDATVASLQQRLQTLEAKIATCDTCSKYS